MLVELMAVLGQLPGRGGLKEAEGVCGVLPICGLNPGSFQTR